MFKKIILGIILLAVCRTAFAQGETIPVSSAEKFNKRGIYNNSDLSFNGQEIISDYDGNLMIKYSTPINLPNDLGDDLTIIYNSNVEHRCFRDGWADGYTINAPEWIIGYKGIALQTFNFETNYLINFDSQDSPQDIPLLIPGYHFDNKLNASDNLSVDYITILRADGSKIILENAESWKETGLYVEKGQNTYGFAIVDSVGVNSRKIYYKPGDGLTYVFEEENLKKVATDTTNTVFRIIYLKEIRYYDTYNLDDSLPMLKKVTFMYEFYDYNSENGRKVIKNIRTSASRSSNEVDFSWSFQSGGICYANIINNNGNDRLSLKAYPYPTNIFSISQENNPSRILSVKEIIDSKGRTDTFTYFSNNDNLTLRRFDVGTRFAYNFPLLKEYTTFSGEKIIYDYNRQVFDSLLEEFPTPDNLSLNFRTGEYFIYDNLNEAGRDCFTNFMLKKKSVYQKQNTQFVHVLDEEYDYYQTDSLGNRTKKFVLTPQTLHGIITAITTTNRLGTSASNKLVMKNFSRYSVEKVLLLSADAGSTVKLINEKIYNNNSEDYPLFYETASKYDTGDYLPDEDTPSQSYWSGTFTELEENITKYAADGSNYSTKKYRNVPDIQYDTLKFFRPDYSLPVFTKKIVKAEKWYDPKNLVTEKQYKNFLSGETSSNIYPSTDTTYFHKIHLPEIEHVYSSDGLTKTHTKYTYHSKDDPDRKGKLESIISDLHAVPDTVKYLYSTNHYRYAYGLPYYKKTSKGVIEEYDYADVALSNSENTANATAIGFLVDEFGSKTMQFLSHPGFSPTPFSTTIKFSNGTTLGSFITANNKKGKPDFEVDLNGYYSSFKYDQLGRLTEAAFPGNFCFDYSTELETSNPLTIIYNDNASAQFPLTAVEKKWLSGNKFLDTQIEFDSFGRLCKTSVRNDAGTLEEKSLKEYDYLGRVVKETQGGSYTHYNNYNVVGDLLNVTNADGSIKTNTYHYGQGTIGDQTYYVQITAKDETGKTKTSYYDQVGNLLAEQLGTNNPTLFYYDSIYRLTKVKTPEGIETTYQYDQNSNVIYKHSPDFGTYRYAYDRFNRLRFQLHVESQEFVFNNYDPLDRLLYTGVINNYSESSFSALNPDNKNTFEDDNNNLVLVNQFDSFAQSGVFVDQNLPAAFAFENPIGRLTASAYHDKPGQTWNYKLYSYDHLGRIKDQYLME